MKKEARDPVEATLTFVVSFFYKHTHVIEAVLAADKDQLIECRMIPNLWTFRRSGHGWSEYEMEESPTAELIEEVRNKIELLDAACEAMVKGTKAEVQP